MELPNGFRQRLEKNNMEEVLQKQIEETPKKVVRGKRGPYKKKKKKPIKKANPLRVNKSGEIVQTAKADLFLEEFLKNGGNATQAALKVFNCTSMSSAGALGYTYLKKAKASARLYMEKKGYSYGRLLDTALEKMETSKTPDWWDRLMKLSDYEDFLSKKSSTPIAVNFFQAHKDYSSEYIEGEPEDAEIIKEEDENLKNED